MGLTHVTQSATDSKAKTVIGFEGAIISTRYYYLIPDSDFKKKFENTTAQKMLELHKMHEEIKNITENNYANCEVVSGKQTIEKVLNNRLEKINNTLKRMALDQIYEYTDNDIKQIEKNYTQTGFFKKPDVMQITENGIAQTGVTNHNSSEQTINMDNVAKTIQATLGIEANHCAKKIRGYISPSGNNFLLLADQNNEVFRVVDVKQQRTAAVIFANPVNVKNTASDPAFRLVIAPQYSNESLGVLCIHEFLKHNPIVPERYIPASEKETSYLQEYSKNIMEYDGKFNAVITHLKNLNPHDIQKDGKSVKNDEMSRDL